MTHKYDKSCICVECHKAWISDAKNNIVVSVEESDSDF